MNRLHVNCFTLLLLTLLLTSTSLSGQSDLQKKLKSIADITDIKPLESKEFQEKYVINFNQPLEHQQPEKGNFKQRVIIAHVGFDRPTVIVTEGYGGTYALSPKYREEISKLFNTNIIFVEHRYFLESTPTPRDWKYLTAKNSANDLHRIVTAFKEIYPGKWIATGISKGGQTTLLYRTFYPNDVDISIPYVAPLCYAAEDGRHEPFLKKVSTPEARKKVEDFQMEVLKRKSRLLPLFEKYCMERKLNFRASIEEIYDYSTLEYSFAFWQWGTPLNSIPICSAPDADILAHLLDISNPDYFIADSPTTSFFVQAARELGYYGYDIHPFKQYLTIKSSKNYLHDLMLPEELKNLSFDKDLSKKVTKFLKKNDPKMIFIYGENDPWTATGITWLKNKKNIHIFIEPEGNHKARISTLPESQKKEAIKLINEWLKE